MLFYDKSKYTALITDGIIKTIEKENNLKCLFGGGYSNKATGTDNDFSDNDFYMVCESYSGIRKRKLSFDEHLLDIVILNYSELTNDNSIYDGPFPSILYRRDDTHINEQNNLRLDYLSSQKLFEILFSNCIWDSGFLVKNIDEIINKISVIHTIDYYFSRTYGNLYNHLKKGPVNAIRVLRTFLWVSCMKWIIEKGTIPNMDIFFMIKAYAPIEIAVYLEAILKRIKSLKKEKNCVSLNEPFTGKLATEQKPKIVICVDDFYVKYIEKELKEVEKYITINQDRLKKTKLRKGEVAFLFANNFI